MNFDDDIESHCFNHLIFFNFKCLIYFFMHEVFNDYDTAYIQNLLVNMILLIFILVCVGTNVSKYWIHVFLKECFRSNTLSRFDAILAHITLLLIFAIRNMYSIKKLVILSLSSKTKFCILKIFLMNYKPSYNLENSPMLY